MKRATFIIFVIVLWLATCQAPTPDTPDVLPLPTNVPAMETAVPPTPTEAPVSKGKLPAPPFEAQTYVNDEAGFALDIPATWTINQGVVGDRGTQIQFLSSPDLANLESMPEGATRLNATIYQWDPKNDLAAYVAHWKTAWDASGFTILDEEELILEQGLHAVQFTVQTPESQVVFLVTALKDQYLVLSGEGSLDLVRQIVGRLRPISP